MKETLSQKLKFKFLISESEYSNLYWILVLNFAQKGFTNHIKHRRNSFESCSVKIIQTRQIAGEKPPLIPISKFGIERIEDLEKKDFCTKTFLSPIYFDGIS